MCSSTHKSMGWKGWSTIPAPHLTESNAPWLDLSYPLGKSTPVPTVPAGKTIVSPFPEARFERIRSMPEHKVNLSEMQMVVHFGTHVDAPVHFIIDGPSFHEIPLDRLYGQGVLLNITCKPVQELGPEIFDGLEIQRGDIVVLNTGWSNYANTARYDEHPYLSAEAAQYLVDCGVKLFAVDFPSPDLPIAYRDSNFDWPAHHIMLRNGLLVAENLRVPKEIESGRGEFLFLALNIEGSDGSPARVVGRSIT